jgi:hypothetical protein
MQYFINNTRQLDYKMFFIIESSHNTHSTNLSIYKTYLNIYVLKYLFPAKLQI